MGGLAYPIPELIFHSGETSVVHGRVVSRDFREVAADDADGVCDFGYLIFMNTGDFEETVTVLLYLGEFRFEEIDLSRIIGAQGCGRHGSS